MSGGEYISLGHEEQKDLVVVLRHLRHSGFVSSIALWGRSMGAATAILRAGKDHCLAACVLDSPFSDLRKVMEEVAKKANLPGIFLDVGIEAVRREVQSRAGFDVNDVVPLHSAPKATCPVLFGVAMDDELVLPYHAQALRDAWGGETHYYSFAGGHNGQRADSFVRDTVKFLVEKLHPWISDFEIVPLSSNVASKAPVDFVKIPQRLFAQSSSASDLAILVEDSPKTQDSGSDELLDAQTHIFPAALPPRNFAQSSSASDLSLLVDGNTTGCATKDAAHGKKRMRNERSPSSVLQRACSSSPKASLAQGKSCFQRVVAGCGARIRRSRTCPGRGCSTQRFAALASGTSTCARKAVAARSTLARDN
jgi:hypothetical protein